MKPKAGSLKISIKLTNLWPDWQRAKKIQTTNISNERRDITIIPKDIKRIISKYYQQYLPINSTFWMKQITPKAQTIKNHSSWHGLIYTTKCKIDS